jgi:hypothetical protein
VFALSIPQVGRRDLYGSKVRDNMLIFPLSEWYTFREPYYSLFHALKTKLLDCRCCCVISYSFRDQDILALIQDEADLNRKLTFCLVDPSARSGRWNRSQSDRPSLEDRWPPDAIDRDQQKG